MKKNHEIKIGDRFWFSMYSENPCLFKVIGINIVRSMVFLDIRPFDNAALEKYNDSGSIRRTMHDSYFKGWDAEHPFINFDPRLKMENVIREVLDEEA